MSKSRQADTHVAGVRVDLTPKPQLIKQLASLFDASADMDQLTAVHTLNPEICMAALSEPCFRDVLNAGQFNVVDGVGLQAVLKLRTHHQVDRTCGSDLVYDLAQMCHAAGRALMIIGGTPNRIEKACARLVDLLPNLQVIGNSPPYTPHLPLINQTEIESLITKHKPAVIAVCLGAPKQEFWINENRTFLYANQVKIAAGLGGTVDFLSGDVPRAPKMLRQIGLEWLYRLYIEPQRWRRQIRTLPKFAALALTSKSFVQNG
ncbi:WecB/TagA/CpsF family glycosyltransferase [Aquabacterium sp.]|uniref:WecB/TagA/CpsF family glycosyltransferase n=1 Tax=Aquabacterium sp. TaxID=1872578 RepID=UPI0035AF87B7